VQVKQMHTYEYKQNRIHSRLTPDEHFFQKV